MSAIQIEIPDDWIKADEIERLENLFQTSNNTEFSEAIKKVVFAALTEYKEMFLGMSLPSRADEIRQHRLFYLIENYYVDRIPSESEVSSMFQLTQTRSKSLIRAVMTRFHYQLESQILDTLKKEIENKIEGEDDTYQLVIKSDIVVEELNLIIDRVAPSLDRIKRVQNSARTYSISKRSYDKIHHDLSTR